MLKLFGFFIYLVSVNQNFHSCWKKQTKTFLFLKQELNIPDKKICLNGVQIKSSLYILAQVETRRLGSRCWFNVGSTSGSEGAYGSSRQTGNVKVFEEPGSVQQGKRKTIDWIVISEWIILLSRWQGTCRLNQIKISSSAKQRALCLGKSNEGKFHGPSE